jgi:hypothetical protein
MLYILNERFLDLNKQKRNLEKKNRPRKRTRRYPKGPPGKRGEHPTDEPTTSRLSSPHVATHDRTTKLATSDRRRQAVLADRNLLIDDLVRETVLTPGHGSDEDGDRMGLREGGDVVGQLDRFRVGREGCDRKDDNIVLSRADHFGHTTIATPRNSLNLIHLVGR